MEAGSEVRVARQPQPWLDLQREREYKTVTAGLQEQIVNGVTTPYNAFAQLLPKFATVWRAGLNKVLSEEDRQAFEMRVEQPHHLTEVAGYPIARPVFVVADQRVYRKVDRVLRLPPSLTAASPAERQAAAVVGQKDAGIHSGGRLIPGRFLGLPEWQKLSLIVTQNDPETIEHEIRHDIDPEVLHRYGYDRMIGEMFAYYGRFMLRGYDRTGFVNTVMARDYYNEYSGHLSGEKRMTYDDWMIRVLLGIGVLDMLRDRVGHVAAERMLVQCNDYQDLMLLSKKNSPVT